MKFLFLQTAIVSERGPPPPNKLKKQAEAEVVPSSSLFEVDVEVKVWV